MVREPQSILGTEEEKEGTSDSLTIWALAQFLGGVPKKIIE